MELTPMLRRQWHWILSCGVGFALCLAPSVSRATVIAVKYSPDITVVLGGVTVYDEDVADDDLAGTVVLTSVGTIPAASDVNAYHHEAGGEDLLSFDTTVSLSGGITAEPRDVVRSNGATFSLEFNGSIAGVPSGVVVDAVTRDISSGDLLLSFDTTVELVAASGTITVDDEDLVSFDGSVFGSVFDGSGAGVPAGLDLDGAHSLGGGKLAVSLDGSGTLGGVSFDDEDVLEYDPRTGAWGMAYDASTQQAGWAGADLVAVHA